MTTCICVTGETDVSSAHGLMDPEGGDSKKEVTFSSVTQPAAGYRAPEAAPAPAEGRSSEEGKHGKKHGKKGGKGGKGGGGVEHFRLSGEGGDLASGSPVRTPPQRAGGHISRRRLALASALWVMQCGRASVRMHASSAGQSGRHT
jgi:hypothetical protein